MTAEPFQGTRGVPECLRGPQKSWVLPLVFQTSSELHGSRVFGRLTHLRERLGNLACSMVAADRQVDLDPAAGESLHPVSSKAIAKPAFGWTESVIGFRSFDLRLFKRCLRNGNLICLAAILRRLGRQLTSA